MRKKLRKHGGGGAYFDSHPEVECIPSGCRLLDRVLGGGYAEGRIVNIVGDRSVGKSLLCIEASANFAIKYPDGLIRYRETEAAFDEKYAATVGLPSGRVELNPSFPRVLSTDGKKNKVETKDTVDTVEDFYADLNDFIRKAKSAGSGLYILDSLDAVGDDAEKKEAFGKDSYGAKKPKLMGQLFRRLIRKIEGSNVCVIIVSQLRDKIGISFGEKQSRSGGRALDFYASQVIWLANLGQVHLTKGKVKRAVGVNIRAKCKKNKVGLAFRDCDFPIRYGYGIDDFEASIAWLLSVKMADSAGIGSEREAKVYLKRLDKMDREEVKAERDKLNKVVDDAWWKIERTFLPTRSKY